MRNRLLIGLLTVTMLAAMLVSPETASAAEAKAVTSYVASEEVVEAVNPWNNTSDTSWYRANASEYFISSAAQLAGLAELVNTGNTFEGKIIRLEKDIFLNDDTYEYEWLPIGTETAVFNGTFDGKNHVIYNMYVSEAGNGGLFGYIGENGVVKAVNISQGELYSGGCIADTNKGMIAFCNNYSYVDGDNAGGICNDNYNLVYGCKNYGEVWGDFAAGIVESNIDKLSTVSQCSNEGFVWGSHEAAGIVEGNYGWIYNCYNTGVISGGSYTRHLAGIVCMQSDTGGVQNCYSTGTFEYDELDIGGVCAPIVAEDHNKKETNCYAVQSDTYTDIGLTNIITLADMKSADFVEKLEEKWQGSVLSAWMVDKDGINDRLPVTVADYNYVNGKYKIQPELWDAYDISMEVYGVEKLGFSYYFNEIEPTLNVENETIAEVFYSDGGWFVRGLKEGATEITIHFSETENNCSADYTITLKVTKPDISSDNENDSDLSDTENDMTDDETNMPPEYGWYEVDGAKYWYENGVRQGLEGRGKEIYDPESDAWYWLDAAYDGKMAVDKDVYQESSGGKWVRYDENGHMIKGEDYRYGGYYYFEPITGTMMKGPVTLADGRKVFYDTVTGQMLKGEQNINGQTYVFDENDGHLINGDDDCIWIEIDGKKYWYENWQRQGWDPADETYRGKEIYDAASDGWYWLDNVQQGAMAVSKEVYQESSGGKWVRYDENGAMIKGWYVVNPFQKYYYDLITGAMAKGELKIDNGTYYFNEQTGVLERAHVIYSSYN